MEVKLKDKVESLRALLDAMESDVEKSDEGTLAAGGRARKHLQELRRVAQEARLFCLERDHSRKGK